MRWAHAVQRRAGCLCGVQVCDPEGRLQLSRVSQSVLSPSQLGEGGDVTERWDGWMGGFSSVPFTVAMWISRLSKFRRRHKLLCGSDGGTGRAISSHGQLSTK